jgi:DNA-binding NarL/FixJ family response regulator
MRATLAPSDAGGAPGQCAETQITDKACLLYIDEQALTRECISRELERHLPELEIATSAEALPVLPDGNARRFEAVILHIHSQLKSAKEGPEADEGNGIAAQLAKLEVFPPETPRVLFSDNEISEHIVEAFQRRARGYIPTTTPIRQVAEAIRFIIAGGTFVPPSILMNSRSGPAITPAVAEPEPSDVMEAFSPRQVEVLRGLWSGLSNKMIAYQLNMCESTVKVHIRHIMRKLNVNNRTQIVIRTHTPAIERAAEMQRRDLRNAGGRDLVSSISPDRTNGSGYMRALNGMHATARGPNGSVRS